MSLTTELTNCFTNMLINTRDIIIDEKGQRDVEKRRAQFNKIMKDFNIYKVNDVKVSLIDGKYYCFDGQMTTKVLKAKNHGNDLQIPCKVYKGLTLYDTAMLFLEQHENCSKVSPAEAIRVMFNYGDKDAIGFVRETEKNGMFISWNGCKTKYSITAVQCAFDIYKNLGDPELYGTFIRVIRQAWDADEDATLAKIMKGLSMFLRAYRSEFSEERLIRQLSKIKPMEIIRNADVDRSNGAKKYAVKILEQYNLGARENVRLAYKL